MSHKSSSQRILDSVPLWLFGCAGLVATTLTVGAGSSLTRAGASMLYWKPHLMTPKSESDWQHVFQEYKDFCAIHLRNNMNLDEFKHVYKWETWHSLLGETTALAFVVPLVYFLYKKKLPAAIQGKLAGVVALGAAQMYFGRTMARHNVDGAHHAHHDAMASFATGGFSTHEAFTLANMSLLLWSGFQLISPAGRAAKLREVATASTLKDVGKLYRYLQVATGTFLGTAIVGTNVTEIDAGQSFNTFPKMGNQWIPDGLMEMKPWYRNLYDNAAFVQLHHRLAAVACFAAYTAVYMKARKPHVWANLPPEARTALRMSMAAVGGQVVFGVTMLVNHVPTSMALVHASGGALILTSSLWALHTLRFARASPLGAAAARAAAKAM